MCKFRCMKMIPKKNTLHSRFLQRGINASELVKQMTLELRTNYTGDRHNLSSRSGISRFDQVLIKKREMHVAMLIDEFESSNAPAIRFKLRHLYETEHEMLKELFKKKKKTKTEKRIVNELKKLIEEDFRFDPVLMRQRKVHLKRIIEDCETLNAPAIRTKLMNLEPSKQEILMDLVSKKNKTSTEKRIVSVFEELIQDKKIIIKK